MTIIGKLILKESRKQDLMQTPWTPKTTFKNSSFQLEESRWLGEKSFNVSSQLVSKLDFFYTKLFYMKLFCAIRMDSAVYWL